MQHRSASDGKETVARALGQTFATVQHLTDLVVAWGSRKLKQVGDQPDPAKPRKGILPTLKRSLRATARFVGNLGDAYYEWYERLKARKMK
ncbi:MAG: hypothetical protein Q7S29_04635 [Candidatus Peribacter sp.]|nr:hypothetical protein [Candidatus Peribacter sp.]